MNCLSNSNHDLRIFRMKLLCVHNKQLDICITFNCSIIKRRKTQIFNINKYNRYKKANFNETNYQTNDHQQI